MKPAFGLFLILFHVAAGPARRCRLRRHLRCNLAPFPWRSSAGTTTCSGSRRSFCNSGISGSQHSTVQSIPGFIARLRPDMELATSWEPLLRTTGEQFAARMVVGLLYAVAALACILAMRAPRSRLDAVSGQRRDLQYLLTICLCPRDQPTVLVSLLLLAADAGPRSSWVIRLRSRGAALLAGWPWVAIALVTPLVVWPSPISNPALEAIYRSVGLSHLLFGGLLWFALVARQLARTRGQGPAG